LPSDPDLAGHLVRLNSSGWAAWRWVAVRGAGFPVASVLALGSPEAAAAADRLVAAQDDLRSARRAAVAALEAARQAAAPASPGQDRTLSRTLGRAIRAVGREGLPAPTGADHASDRALAAVHLRAAEVAEAGTALAAEHEVAWRRQSAVLAETAADPRFREAVTWQNRSVVATTLDIVRAPAANPTAQRRRRRELVVASYLQRYCTKNDTVGFFGPLAWASVDGSPGGLALEPAADLIEDSRVHFEHWTIDRLAETLARDDRYRPWMVPRPDPASYLSGDDLRRPLEPPVCLSAVERAVYSACDGRRTARELASAFDGAEPAVMAALDRLARLRAVAWDFPLPLSVYPERDLRRLLSAVEDERLRARGLGALDLLERVLDAVRRAAGDADRLGRALAVLDDMTGRLTGGAARRRPGQTHAGRTPTYLDCRRATTIRIGSDLLAGLGEPLGLVLRSARWVTAQSVGAFHAEAERVWRELLPAHPDGVPAPEFWIGFAPRLYGGHRAVLAPVEAELRARWRQVLDLDRSARRADYRGEDLRERVAAAFPDVDAGCRLPVHHSPDVLVLAPDGPGARFVLGELHLAINTLDQAGLHCLHHDPGWLSAAFAADVQRSRVVPTLSKHLPKVTGRIGRTIFLDSDRHLLTSHDTAPPAPGHVLPMGGLVVARDGGVVVRAQDGSFATPLVQFVADLLVGQIADRFHPFADGGHLPRITIDRLVVCRERWELEAGELAFAGLAGDDARFAGARRMRRDHAMPRFVFVRSPVEPKPVYVDFDSPALVESLARMVRHAGESTAPFTITEMLPDPSQLWLRDAEGRRYTSELRIIAVDLEA
jgi:hypothetical protein